MGNPEKLSESHTPARRGCFCITRGETRDVVRAGWARCAAFGDHGKDDRIRRDKLFEKMNRIRPNLFTQMTATR